ncbi:hypothetical protein [Dielma fastidiosa]|uniref:hypothetical protein n=1 Tax=Dielma fastidiosa TaxID=1034346 RepID=UPI000E4A5923|nr:hypothetical protein [Dielma fastidiosa]RHN01468.1 hypothetical protein DWZ33_05605 [Dielma fastidiosa]
MILDRLIYDRTAADVNRAIYLRNKGYENLTDAEKQEWSSDLKGCLNCSDLNRVAEACRYINAMYRQWGYDVTIPVKTDFTMDDFQDLQLMSDYCLSVLNLMGSIKNGRMGEVPRRMTGATHVTQNNIERNLYLMPHVLKSVQEGMQVLKCTLGGDEFE